MTRELTSWQNSLTCAYPTPFCFSRGEAPPPIHTKQLAPVSSTKTSYGIQSRFNFPRILPVSATVRYLTPLSRSDVELTLPSTSVNSTEPDASETLQGNSLKLSRNSIIKRIYSWTSQSDCVKINLSWCFTFLSIHGSPVTWIISSLKFPDAHMR